MNVWVCEDSLTGVFAGVYDAWASGYAHEENRLITGDTWNMELFSTYRKVKADEEKANKVMRTVRQRLGEEAYWRLCYAVCSDGEDKADAVYHMIVRAIHGHRESHILEDMQDTSVFRVFELSRSVWRELHHHYGFIRFHELKNGVLCARCTPQYRITTMLAEHFTDRFPAENFIILNMTYREAAVHLSGKGYFLCGADGLSEEFLNTYSETEAMFENLWKEYFHVMTIEERRNPNLQRQLYPKKYWKNSVEMR